MKLISVGYGHHPSGKLYDYVTEKNYRTGDNIVVPVTHAKSRLRYNTLATVMLTSEFDSAKAMEKRQALYSRNIRLKWTSGAPIRTLPGYVANSQNWTEDNENGTGPTSRTNARATTNRAALRILSRTE